MEFPNLKMSEFKMLHTAAMDGNHEPQIWLSSESRNMILAISFPPSVIFRQFLGIENMIQRINHAYPGSTNPIHLLPSNSLAITQPCSKPCAVELVEVETICQLFASTTKKRSDTWILSTIYGSIMIYIYIDIHPSNQISIQ